MAYQRNTFYDPFTTETYPWHINHSEETQFGKARNVTTGAPTGYSGLVRQQGDDEPMVIELSGTILHHVQHEKMVHFFNVTQTRSIYFTDFAGDSYEVLITSYSPTRQRTLRNPRDSTIPLHFWRYTLRMDVLRFLNGVWAANGVTP